MAEWWDGTVMPALIDVLVRPTLLAAAIGLVLFVARVKDAALSNAAWRVALAVMLAAPVLPRVVPPIPVAVPAPPPVLSWLSDPPASEAVPNQPTAPQPIVSDAGPRVLASTPARPVGGRAERRPDWQTAAMLIYGSGVLLLGVRLWAGWRGSRRVQELGAPVAPSGESAGGARVCESRLVTVPVTVGAISPTVVLPAGWRDWPAAKLRAVLAHEAAHVARRDPLVALVARLNRVIFWFHPVAWWIERRLAATAEQACDDAAVGSGIEDRRYAEVLLQMAADVRAQGGRLLHLGVGAHGTDMESRIERLLDGRPPRASRAVRAVLGTLCLTLAVLGVSCQQRARELRPDPAVAAQIAERTEAAARYDSAKKLTDSEVNVLEARVAADPEDLDARDTLLMHYRWGSRSWTDVHLGFRGHALWLIAHHPESSLVVDHQISSRSDPTGDAVARRLWLAHVNRPDASPAVLSNAAYYFQKADQALAADLLLRGQALDPEGPPQPESPTAARLSWSARLGLVYAVSIKGERNADGTFTESPFGPEARRKLAETRDVTSLITAASWLVNSGPEARREAARCAERAMELAPNDVRARALVTTIRMRERARTERWFGIPTEALHEQLSTFSEEDRLSALPETAERDYLAAEHTAWTRLDLQQEAARLYARSKATTELALDLLRRSEDHDDYGALLYRARITRGLHAQREGDRRTAVRFLRDAAAVPPTETLAYTHRPAALEQRLVHWLLKDGERDSVATFLERTAAFMLADKERRLTDAAAIRRGVMPRDFQYAMSREATEAAR